MILSAQMLDSYDRCERKFAFEREWESKSISPLGVLYGALEAGLLSDSPEQTAKDSTFTLATSHELATDQNAYMVIRHTGYLAGIVATALRETLGPLRRIPPTDCGDFQWESNLFEDSRETLHQILLVSHWDDDRLRAAAHAWATVGELAALRRPLTLTAAVIGPHRAGRRHSAWAKGFLHPQNHVLRFARRSAANGLRDSWEEVWRETRGEISTADWLKRMRIDGMIDQLILRREIAFNAKDNRMIAARREMSEVMELMPAASERSPMRRSSCDETGKGPCPFQSVCYSPVETSPDRLVHLYRQRDPNAVCA